MPNHLRLQGFSNAAERHLTSVYLPVRPEVSDFENDAPEFGRASAQPVLFLHGIARLIDTRYLVWLQTGDGPAAPPELPLEQFVFQHRRPLTDSKMAVFIMYHVRRASLVYKPRTFTVRR